ncbi:MAG: phosphohistidine-like domain-containing protein [Gammaproteobacteria bacterium]
MDEMTAHWEQQDLRVGEVGLRVAKQRDADRLRLRFTLASDEECRLHWGLERRHGAWLRPPESCWPPQTEPFNNHAVQSLFVVSDQGERTLELELDLSEGWRGIAFVLYFPLAGRWVKDGKRDFRLPLLPAMGQPSAQATLAAASREGDWRRYSFDLGQGEFLWAAVAEKGDNTVQVLLACDAEAPLYLHWGVAERFPHEWRLPPQELQPTGSNVFDEKAVRTPFGERDGVRWLGLMLTRLREAVPLRGLDFVLYQPQAERWLKSGGQDMHLGWVEASHEPLPDLSPGPHRLAEAIISAEMGKSSWTLMHRFNLAHDLLQGAEADQEALALIFAWLRYSAIRQLDWQRRFNTKPRELAHAQNRLTFRLSEMYRPWPQSRVWIRLLLTTVGRGGGRGQQVRDDILNIMHRHKLKHGGERFMEEWHQKLHNNTSPDDIVICEAYLAFLDSDGDLDRFYGVLRAHGVTRERLQSFDRPIKTDPLFFADKKAGLMEDFRNYLRVLKSVHASTDLETAVTAAREMIGAPLQAKLRILLGEMPTSFPDWVRPKERYKSGTSERASRAAQTAPSARSARPLSPLERAQQIVAARRELALQLAQAGDAGALRELLYLDLALEDALRVAIEGQELGRLSDQNLFDLTRLALTSFCLSIPDEELELASRQLDASAEPTGDGRDGALRAKAITDRVARLLGDWTETLYARLQPKAELLGRRLAVEEWTITLFTEEVIRGGPAFTLSMLLRRLDRVLRARAGVGGWQVISAAPAVGRLRKVNSLMAVQGEQFREATLLVTSRVSGEEEIPEGVRAILTTDTPDLVSHVAVRARNARVLFATCFDEQVYASLEAHEGRNLALRVSTAGDVTYEDAGAGESGGEAVPSQAALRLRRRAFSQWAIAEADFNATVVGAKSSNLTALSGKLPDWVRFPASMALPFGVFEAVLAASENRAVRETIEQRLAEVATNPPQQLPRVRAAIEGLTAPEALRSALMATWQGCQLPNVAWDVTWRAVTQVWASKWTDRAYYSRVARGVAHDDLMMAVLIQQVVEADYAFVLHTVNPMTGCHDELYAELVLGLGETLVGNYPGRALSLVMRKDDLSFQVQAYPSKSIALYGKGVIYRSDSNGEDLQDFAGAGLYDSLLAESPCKRLLDYVAEPLLHDRAFGEALFTKLATLGIAIEQLCGSPQDIEGAVQAGEYYVVQTRPQVGL